MIRPDHPVVRAMAEETAMEVRCAANGRAIGSLNVDAFATLLVDFDRPATRDAWIRWGRKFALDAVLSGDPDRILRDGPSVIRWGEHLRNNPEALEATVCVALETA